MHPPKRVVIETFLADFREHTFLGTSVNKGKGKDRGCCYAPELGSLFYLPEG